VWVLSTINSRSTVICVSCGSGRGGEYEEDWVKDAHGSITIVRLAGQAVISRPGSSGGSPPLPPASSLRQPLPSSGSGGAGSPWLGDGAAAAAAAAALAVLALLAALFGAAGLAA